MRAFVCIVVFVVLGLFAVPAFVLSAPSSPAPILTIVLNTGDAVTLNPFAEVCNARSGSLFYACLPIVAFERDPAARWPLRWHIVKTETINGSIAYCLNYRNEAGHCWWLLDSNDLN